MTDIAASRDKVMQRLEELVLKPKLTEDEQRQFEALLKADKVMAESFIANYEKECKANEQKLKLMQMKTEAQWKKKEHYRTIWLKIFEVGLPLFVTCLLFGASLSFETTQSYSSRTAQIIKNLLNLGR